MGRNAVRQSQECLEPLSLGLAELSDLGPLIGSANDRTNRDDYNIFQQMLAALLAARVGQIRKMIQNRWCHPWPPGDWVH